jgi:nicotinamide-nucleotide amidase
MTGTFDSDDASLTGLAKQVGAALKGHGMMMATAESCTGGGIAEAVTRIPGSSAWFDCAFVSYSYEAKTAMLGVHRDILVDFGAVSEETAREMADAAITRSRAQVAVAVTGIAGPEGGMPDKPVGTVWFAWKFPKKPVITEVCHFSGDRAAVRHQTIAHALKKLLHNLS